MIAEVLEANVRGGTGKRAQIEGHHVAGKTGTTQNYFDAWFVGFTDYYTTAVWLGDPRGNERIEFPEWSHTAGRGGFGGELPTAIWGAYMAKLHEDLQPVEFAAPDDYGGGRFIRAPGEINLCNPSRDSGDDDDEADSDPRGCSGSDDDDDDDDSEDDDEDDGSTTTQQTTPSSEPTQPTQPTRPPSSEPTVTVPPTDPAPTVTVPPDE
jgi:penicillin-binding protein 1A